MVIDVSVRCFDARGQKIPVAEDQPLKVWPAKVMVGPHRKTKDITVKFIPTEDYHKSAPCKGIVLLKVRFGRKSGENVMIDSFLVTRNIVKNWNAYFTDSGGSERADF